ncbi:MAG: DMT family transporter [Pseudomonadota bacterium]
MTATRSGLAVSTVVFCAAMWGLWWLPVELIEGTGVSGPRVGIAMNLAVLPVAILWLLLRPGAMSARALVGAVLVGAAVSLYAISVTYTDFLRAVLLFYLAPAWSTIIECVFFGRRWSVKSVFAIGLGFLGIALISRGEISFDGLGAIGDWMALVSGATWSAGTALIFSSRRAGVAGVLVVTALGGIAVSLGISAAMGQAMLSLPQFGSAIAGAPLVYLFAAAYVGILLSGTVWGAFVLPPAVMSYLLSIEIVSGVLSSTLILGERFGVFEMGGAACILGAVFIEVLWSERVSKTAEP